MLANKAIRTGIIIACLGLAQLSMAADPSLIGWWVFDDGAGKVAEDRCFATIRDATVFSWVSGISTLQ